MSDQNSFQDFLMYNRSSHDVGLVIAKDLKEQAEFLKGIEKEGFKKANTVWELFDTISTNSKTYIVADELLKKDLYDFIVQYPTGQIEIFDAKSMKPKVVTPKYDNVSVILVITKDHLLSVEKQGFNLLSATGMAFQN